MESTCYGDLSFEDLLGVLMDRDKNIRSLETKIVVYEEIIRTIAAEMHDKKIRTKKREREIVEPSGVIIIHYIFSP